MSLFCNFVFLMKFANICRLNKAITIIHHLDELNCVSRRSNSYFLYSNRKTETFFSTNVNSCENAK